MQLINLLEKKENKAEEKIIQKTKDKRQKTKD